MNSHSTPMIDINGLKPQQIQQIQTLIEDFKRQNRIEENISPSQEPKPANIDSLDDIFFESEIMQPFNRSELYGKRG